MFLINRYSVHSLLRSDHVMKAKTAKGTKELDEITEHVQTKNNDKQV